MKRATLILVIIVTLFGCSRSIDCIDPPILVSFISVPPNSLDTLVIRKFVKGSNFQTLHDTVRVTPQNIRFIEQRGDTSHLILHDPDLYPKPGFDWQIFIPALNRTISITDINKRDQTGKCAAMQMPVNCLCNNEILSLKVDNQTGVLLTNRGYNLIIR